jgi:hypothetical protein
VSAYLANRDLPKKESLPERFFLNVVLLRVPHAHALNAAPAWPSVGCRRSAESSGDPRVGMAGAYFPLAACFPPTTRPGSTWRQP